MPRPVSSAAHRGALPPLPRHPASLRQKLQKRRGSGSFLKFWLVSESSVVTPLPASSAIMGGVKATSAHTPPEA
mgnify:CR=1 FL=1